MADRAEVRGGPEAQTLAAPRRGRPGGAGPPAAEPGLPNAALARLAQGTGVARSVHRMAVSQPGDPVELEAEEIAARIVRAPLRTPTAGSPPAAPVVAREAPPGSSPPVDAAREVTGPSGGDPSSAAGLVTGGPDVPVSAAVSSVVASPGRGEPLDPGVRARVEPHLGADLTGVRVHRGRDAAGAAAELQARAFTVGADIFLGEGQSPSDLGLLAHEATHVVQQQAAPARSVSRATAMRDFEATDLLPDWVIDEVRDAARDIPGYTLLGVITGKDPLTDAPVDVSWKEFVEKLLTYGPFGDAVAEVLQAMDVLGDVATMLTDGLAAHNLTISRIGRDISAAWDEMSVTEGISGNVAIVERYVDAIVRDIGDFVDSVVDAVIAKVREVVADVAAPLLQRPEIAPYWNLAVKVFHHDPLRGVDVNAPTVEILGDFLTLIGKGDVVAQMTERGTLQETADWLDLQWARFIGILGQASALFADAWDAISPANLPDLFDNLSSLADRALTLVREVGSFAYDVIAEVLVLVKRSLLGMLSEHAHKIPGFHLLTLILGTNPFTGEEVPLTAENLIKGFITLLPGGEETYAELAQSGVVGEAASRIEGAMARLDISWGMITETFLGIWDTLQLADLLTPFDAFDRILDAFGGPIGRIVEFVGVVVQEVITLILRMMNFPSELLGNIVANASAAIDDITNDPVGFLRNVIAAMKAGFESFFGKIATYLLEGLAGWLFRGLRGLGIEPPTSLTVESAITLVVQVLGVTAETLWTKLGERIGPERVEQIRGALDTLTGAWSFIKDVQERGITAVWEFISGQLSNLWDTILATARDWIMSEIVDRVTVKLLSMLDPTGIMAIINGAIAFFNAVESAIEYLREMLEIVDKYVSTIAAAARGEVGPGAAMLERGLADAIPVAIGFLANQVGLGNVPEKVLEIIESLRELVDQALDWLFDQAMALGEAALGALGGGAPEEQPGATEQPGAEQPSAIEEPGATEPAEQAAGQIPPGLAPEDVKTHVLDLTSQTLAGAGLPSVEAMHRRVDAIMAANRDRGLKSLELKVDPQTRSVEVVATASPGKKATLAWSDIFSEAEIDTNADLEAVREELRAAGQSSFAALALDGEQVGELSESGGGTHAEEGILTSGAWTGCVADAAERAGSGHKAVITLLINRTPCVVCVAAMKSAIAEARAELGEDAERVEFRLAARGMYKVRRGLKQEELAALFEGVTRLIGDARAKKSFGKPFEEVYRRELAFWRDDLRSQSTEWVDADTGEIASGLGELTAAGWRIFGLDAGQKVTPRQIELRDEAEALMSGAAHKAT